MARLTDTRIDGNLQVTDSLNIRGTSLYRGDTSLQIGSSICVDGDISITSTSGGTISAPQSHADCFSINTRTLTTTGDTSLTNGILSVNSSYGVTVQGDLGLNAVGGGSLTIADGNITCNGAISSVGNISSQGNISAEGDVTADSFNARSDARLKENISSHNFENSILDLDVKKFDFINGPKNQIGCLAQDLIKICPEIVNEGDDGYLKINEVKIIYLLLQEMKMLRNEVDTLKTQIEYKNIDL